MAGKVKAGSQVWQAVEGAPAATEVPGPSLWEWLREARPADGPNLWETLATRLNLYKYRPQRIEQFEIQHFTNRHGQPYAIVRNPAQGTYLRLSERDLFIWEQLDGQHTNRDLAVAYVLKYGSFNFEGIILLLNQLRAKGFLQEEAGLVYAAVHHWLEAQGLSYRLRRLVQAFLMKDFSFRNVDDLLGALYRYGFRVWFTRVGAILLHLLVVAGLIAAGRLIASDQYDAFDFGPSPLWRIVSLGLLNQVAIFVHETAHGVACKHYGRHVRRGGVLIYLGRLAFFVDTTDIWMAARRPRLVVSWAGPLAHLVLSSMAALSLTFLDIQGDTANLLYQFTLLAGLIGLFNLNPLLELDGYYMLMDYLEVPNLRRRALAFVGRPFWTKVRQRSRLTSEEWGFTVFGALSGFYTVSVIIASVLLWQKRIAGPLAGWLGETNARWLVG
ncbi:MAG: hypothetical protein AB1791_21505, partial [Chloroflexota bacterium]